MLYEVITQFTENDPLVKIAECWHNPVKLAGGQAFHQADNILKQKGDTDGGNQWHEPGCPAQGPVGNLV